MMKFRKKGNLEMMTSLALFIVLTVMIVSLGSNVVQEVNGNVPDNSTADNVSTLANQGLQKFAYFFEPLGIVTIAVIIIGVLAMLKSAV